MSGYLLLTFLKLIYHDFNGKYSSEQFRFRLKELEYEWIQIGLMEKGHTTMVFEWRSELWTPIQPKKVNDLDFDMSLKRRINRKRFQCLGLNETNPHQCLIDFYQERLNCSFPWEDHQNKELELCQNETHEEALKDLVKTMANDTSEIRQDLEQLDCWIPKCSTTNWKLISTQIQDHSEYWNVQFKIQKSSSSGVSFEPLGKN